MYFVSDVYYFNFKTYCLLQLYIVQPSNGVIMQLWIIYNILCAYLFIYLLIYLAYTIALELIKLVDFNSYNCAIVKFNNGTVSFFSVDAIQTPAFTCIYVLLIQKKLKKIVFFYLHIPYTFFNYFYVLSHLIYWLHMSE